MIDQDKMRALAHQLRAWNWLNDPLPNQAADAIDLLLAELEAAAADRDRLDWIMRELSGKALRQICVVYSDASLPEFRRAIDAAIAQRQEGLS